DAAHARLPPSRRPHPFSPRPPDRRWRRTYAHPLARLGRRARVDPRQRLPRRRARPSRIQSRRAHPGAREMKKLSHYDSAGSPRMVDVSAKAETKRTARAHAFVRIAPAVLKKLPLNPKGNPLEIARIAGIAAAKRTSELIPLCHPLMLTHAGVEVTVEK